MENFTSLNSKELLNSKTHSYTLSKKFLFSLATVSVLATCANAQITGPSCSGGNCETVNDNRTGTIVIKGDGSSNSLTITNSGTISNTNGNHKAVDVLGENAGTLTVTTLKNEGTINGKVVVENSANGFTGTINVNTLENKGQINNQVYIGLWGSKTKGTINVDKFENSGTISNTNDNSIVIEGKDTTVKTFTNSGTIQSDKNKGVVYINRSTIQNFINSGTINNSIDTVVQLVGGNIKTLINSGILNSESTKASSAGIKIDSGGTIDQIKNTGKIISQSFGISVTHGKFGTLEISDGGVVQARVNGIDVGQWQTLGDLIIDGDGSRIYGGQYGIGLGVGASTQNITLENGGYIEGGIDGIHLDNAAQFGGNLILEGEGSVVKGGRGAAIANNGGKISGHIKISNGATIYSDSGVAISNSGAGVVTGGITISGESTKLEGDIVNTDNASINSDIKVENGAIIEGSIKNEGKGNILGGIKVEQGGTITGGILNTGNGNIQGAITNESDNDLSIKNDKDATIGGGIVNSGNGNIHIDNQGTVNKNPDNGSHITNNGNGNIVVDDWVVSTGNDGKLDTVIVGGNHTDKVTIDKVTIDQGGLDLGGIGSVGDIVSGVKPGQIGNIGTNGGGELSFDFDPISGRVTTDFNLNASIAGATFRSLINTTSRRSTFIDSVMGNSMQHFAFAKSSTAIAMQEKGNLYASASDYIKNDFNNGSYGYNKEHSLFILPYASSQNVELSLNEESKGHTKGTIIGYSTLKDSGIYGVYAGYEDTKMKSTYFDINNRSYYAGLKYFNTLFTTSKGQEVYLKAQGKTAFVKNNLTKKIGKNEAKADPNSYAYGMSADLGMNFNYGNNIFSPEAGLAYEGGYTEAFSMINTKGEATVKGGERTYKNYLNLFSTRTSFTWFRDWLPNLKTSMTLGAKFNINPEVTAKARFGQIKVKDKFYLPRVQRYVTTSMIVPLNDAFYFSLNYNGMFDAKGNTHTGFAQFNYVW
ncbi:autotransporter outer membrane beta-barrel domain-containing protein [Campylobacter taeniopygiae]|uniref:Autotransporter domain-containing protein n=1 Tax=Campylobacter taeniopygiae TaxID=2510188 RepID=A0ABY2TJ96_9BACT|nr:autotransporter outer membrane beta-barrel domain-containing protein [Campylobacter taeniopygiae]TKX34170.1 hypothetical protein CQA75_03435 [Campylobacter taeniopygiae]